MSWKLRNGFIIAVVLVVSIFALSAVSAQDDASTPEPTAEAMPESGTSMSGQAFLGVSLQDTDEGVTVVEVLEGTAAADAGLQASDVITAINGEEVADAASTAAIVGSLSVGDVVTVDFTRDGEAMSVEATLGEQLAVPVPPIRQPRNQPYRNAPNMGGFGLSYDDTTQMWTINNLPENSALYDAGLRAGDVIVGFDGEAYDPMGLFEYIRSLDADATVTITVERDGAEQDIQIAIADLHDFAMPFGMTFGFGRGGREHDGMPNMPHEFFQMMPGMMSMYAGNGWLGVTFVSLDAETAAEHDVTETEGALITAVDTESPAADAGLQENDVITAVNGEPVDEERTLRDRLIAYEPDDTVTLTVLRDGEELSIDVTLGEPQAGDMMQMFRGMMPGMMPNDRYHFNLPIPAQPEPPEATEVAPNL